MNNRTTTAATGDPSYYCVLVPTSTTRYSFDKTPLAAAEEKRHTPLLPPFTFCYHSYNSECGPLDRATRSARSCLSIHHSSGHTHINLNIEFHLLGRNPYYRRTVGCNIVASRDTFLANNNCPSVVSTAWYKKSKTRQTKIGVRTMIIRHSQIQDATQNIKNLTRLPLKRDKHYYRLPPPPSPPS